MMGHDVYFDVTSYRVGWAESDCDYTSLVKQYTDGDWTPPRTGTIPLSTPPDTETCNMDGGDTSVKR